MSIESHAVPNKAATIVVHPTPGIGDATTIQEAINLLPAGGGKVFVREGTYSISSTITLPADKDVKLEGPGATVFIGSNTIAAITIADGLTTTHQYNFDNLKFLGGGVTGQTFLKCLDDSGLVRVHGTNCNITDFETFVDTLGDLTYNRAHEYKFDWCRIVAPNLATTALGKTPSPAGSWDFGVCLVFEFCDWGYDLIGSYAPAWGANCDIDITIRETLDYIYIRGDFQCDAMLMDGANIYIYTSGTIIWHGLAWSQYDRITHGSYILGKSGETILLRINSHELEKAYFYRINVEISDAYSDMWGCIFENTNVGNSQPLLKFHDSDYYKSSVIGCRFKSTVANTALIEVDSTNNLRIIGCEFVSNGAVPTIQQTNGSVNTFISGCIGIQTGGGLSLTDPTSRVEEQNNRNVMTFGATGDGTTDDSAAIQDAIDALPSSGGTVYFPPGNYYIVTGLTLSDKSIEFIGAGEGATIISLGTNAITAFSIPNGLTDVREYGWKMLRVTGGSVTGQKFIDHKDVGGRGNVTVEDCYINGIERVFDYTEYDTTYTRLTLLRVNRCRADVPSSLANTYLVRTKNPGGTYAGSVSAVFDNCTCYKNGQWIVNGDIDYGITFGEVNLKNSSFDGMNWRGCYCAITAGATVVCNGWSWGGTGVDEVSGVEFSGSTTGYATLEIKWQPTLVGSEFWQMKVLLSGTTSAPSRAKGCRFRAYNSSGTTWPPIFLEISANRAAVEDCSFRQDGGGGSSVMTHAIKIDSSVLYTTVSGCQFELVAAGTKTLEEAAGAGPTTLYGCSGLNQGSGLVLTNEDSTVNLAKRKVATGVATTDAYVESFTHINPRGVLGTGLIKNTGGVNTLTVKRTAIDSLGTTDSVETDVLPGSVAYWSLEAAVNTAIPPFVSYKVEAKSKVAGNSTTYSLRHTTMGAEV